MTHIETSWFERYYAVVARDERMGRCERSSSTSCSDNSSYSATAWWQLYLHAVTAGVSAAVSYHLLQQIILKCKRFTAAETEDSSSARDPPTPRRANKTTTDDDTTNEADATRFPFLTTQPIVPAIQTTLLAVPAWFWIFAPGLLSLLPKQSHCCLMLGTATIFCVSGTWVYPDKRENRQVDKEDNDDNDDDNKTHKQENKDTGKEQEDKASSDVFPDPSESSSGKASVMIAVAELETRSSSNVPTTRGIVSKKPYNNNTTKQQRSTSHKYLELLVHNISHTDLVLGLDTGNKSSSSNAKTATESPYFRNYIRPRFSSFDLFARLVLDHIQNTTDGSTSDDQVIYFPRYQRSMEDPRYSIREFTATCDPPMSPTGLKLAVPAPMTTTNVQEDVRIREQDQDEILAALEDESCRVRISHVFFPLLATILPVWQRQIQQKEYHGLVKRVLILVTGVGTPRNWTHSVKGNSTEACADLMQAFLARIDPGLTVVKIHSDDTNIFRYDENVLFVERQLMPTINAYRDAHATGTPYPDEQVQYRDAATVSALTAVMANFDDTDWRSSMRVTLSFADGSPARTHAIQASLRPYKPTYFHFWQLKTFWHESKVVDDDIEVHSFETMETLPPVDADRVQDPGLQAVVQEMRAFYHEMTNTLASGNNDIHRFWLRKTHKPVLAVLLVQSADMAEPRLYRGTNMEVSMPTGSLCAERSAIGSALASKPNLKRQDLKLIAVLAVPPVEVIVDSVTMEGRGSMRRVPSYSSIVEESSDPDDRRLSLSNSRKSSIGSEFEPSTEEWVLSEQNDAMNTSICSSTGDKEEEHEVTASTEPLRRISLFSKTPAASRKSKRTVVVQSAKDINPLAPCGACNEWLKKIAESNPYFKIVTFTDANCNGIYVSPCQN
jgi:cytidine deaminase